MCSLISQGSQDGVVTLWKGLNDGPLCKATETRPRNVGARVEDCINL